MMDGWLEKGLAGFRVDAILNIKKVFPMKDYEPDREDGMVSLGRMLKDSEGIWEYWGEPKEKVLDQHEAFTVAEVAGER